MTRLRAGLLVLLAPAVVAQDVLLKESRRGLPGDAISGGRLAAGDIDGDGWADLLRVANNGQKQLFFNRYGEFEAAAPELVPDLGSDDLMGAALGDLDGDGDLDAVVPQHGAAGHVLIWGATGFQSHPFAPGTLQGGSPILGDLDGDGDLDAYRGAWLTMFGTGMEPWLLARNTGAGTFTDASAFLPSGLELGEGDFGDVDGDGDLDLLLWKNLFRNTGAGFVDASAGLPQTGGAPRFGDVDGDGDLDAVRRTGDAEVLWLGDGTGAFTDAPGHFPDPPGSDSTMDHEVGDVDGDGDLDVLVANGGSICSLCGGKPDRLYRNDGAGIFSEAPFPSTNDQTTSAVLADLDADGDLDAALAREGAPVYQHLQDLLLRNDGSGTFWDATDPFPIPEQAALDAALVDADRDGDLDVYCVNQDDDSIWINGGDALFTTASAPYLAASKTRAVVAADLDGDGHQDLAIGSGSGIADHWLLNLGLSPASLFSKLTLPGAPAPTEDLAAGDVDGDGDLDLMLANYGAQNQLLRYVGALAFQDTTATSMPADTEVSTAVSLVDVDQDGDLDGLLAGTTGRILTNDGLGTFSATVLPGGSTQALLGGDFDADGDEDLYLARNPDQLLLGTGGGSFVDASAQLPGDPLDGVEDALLLDIDEDQDLDVLAAGSKVITSGSLTYGVRRLSLLENDGAATFADSGHRISNEVEWAMVEALAVGDLDGDLDADVLGVTDLSYTLFELTVAPQRALLLANRTRHLAVPALPGLGKDVRFVVTGAPLQPWFLAYSTGTAEVSLPPYGTLLLDPGALHVLAFGALDASGQGELIASVPTSAVLLGSTLYWQALVGAPLRLTNRERTTFVGL